MSKTYYNIYKDSSGSVGIGTTSPSQALNIARSDASGSAEFDLYSTNSAKQPMLTFRKSASNTIGTKSVTPSGGELGEIEFIGVNTGSNFAVKSASIIGLQDGAAGATYIPGALTFGTGTNSAAVSERMRIDSSGNIGIGTTSADYKLTVLAGSGEEIRFYRNATAYLKFAFGTANAAIYSGGDIQFLANGSTVNSLIINSSLITLNEHTYVNGNLGIGTSSPSYNLHVSSSSTSAAIGITGTGGSKDTWTITSSDSGGYGVLNFRDEDSSTTALTLRQDGNVGIGTTSPNAKLTIDLGAEGDYLVAGGDNASNARALKFTSSTSAAGSNGAKHTLNALSTNGEIAFAINNSEKAIINKDGSVGIGTTSPLSEIHIEKGLTGDSSQLRIANGAGATVRMGITGSGANENAHIKTNSGEALEFQIGRAADSASPDVIFKSGGGIQFGAYGIGTFTGTTAYVLAVDSSGNIIETSSGSGSVTSSSSTTNYLTKWTNGASEIIGNSVAYDDGTNIGIGTTSPVTKLHVSASASGDAANLLLTNTNDTNGDTASIQFSMTDTTSYNKAAIYFERTDLQGEGSLHLATSNSGDSTSVTKSDARLTITKDGNVGIGTASPSAPLEIAGAASATDTGITIKNGSATRLRLFHNDNAGASYLTSYDGVGAAQALNIRSGNKLYMSGGGGSTHVTVDTSGNVGIGTTSPSYRLHVNGGGARIEDGETTLSPDSTSNSGISTRALTIMNLVDTGWTTDALTAYNATTSYDILNRASYSFFARPQSTNIITHCTEVNDNAHLYRFVNLNSAATEPLLRWVFYQYDGSGTTSGDFKVASQLFEIQHGGSTQLMIQGDGNVGIGTDTPDYKLDVEGGLRVYQNTSAVGAGMGLTVENDGTGDAIVQYLLTQNIRWVTGIDNSDGDKFKIASSADLNSDAHLTIQADGNVGIGTTSPTRSLHISNSTYIQLKLQSTASAAGIEFISNSGSAYEIQAYNSNFFVYDRTASEYRFLIASNGNIGIGTNSPTEKLEVNGNIKISSNGTGASASSYSLLFYGTTSSSVQTDQASINTSPYASNTNGGDLIFKTSNTSNVLTERMRIDGAGCVGIGTTSPATPLNVYFSGDSGALIESSNSHSSLYIKTNAGTFSTYIRFRDDTADRFFLQCDANHFLLFRPNATSTTSNQAVINTSGNLGIGFYNATAKLQIGNGTTASSNRSPVAIFSADGGNATLDALSLVNSRTGAAGNGTAINFHNGDTWTPTGRIECLQAGVANTDSELKFYTYKSGTGLSQRMVIDYEGSVGIGTTAPSYPLDIEHATTPTVSIVSVAADVSPRLIIDAGGGAGTADPHIKFDSDGVDWSVGVDQSDGDKFKFATSNGLASEKVVIQRDGNVGVGINDPESLLHVHSATNETAAIISSVVNSTSGSYLRLTEGAESFATYGYLGGYIQYDGSNNLIHIGRHNTNGTSLSDDNPVITIERDTGNVGIGTTSPGYKLEVNGSFAATTKSFVIDHPTKEGKRLVYASLEGPENGVYVRGRGDSDVIELPDYWVGLVHEDSITVQITAKGKDENNKIRKYSVNDIVDNKVYIYTDSGDNIYSYFYIVHAERKDVDNLQVEIDK